MLTKLSNNRINLLQCVIVPASHAFKKEVAMNGNNRILSARLGEDIIVKSSPGEKRPRAAGFGPVQWSAHKP